MATTREFLDFILEQFSPLGEVRSHPMMGEYILYYRDKYFASVCDNRLFLKPVPSALKMLPDAPLEPSHAGASPMILVENLDDRETLIKVVPAMYDELPLPKKRSGKRLK
jgi:TfoX/Sxy family transcriptional regulator of competence genes